jgi:phospholipid/cholesterol/gamma-HCH transport system substrate-binding protein
MKSWLTPLKVGLVTLVAVAGLLFALQKLQTGALGSGDTYGAHAMLDDVLGLAKRSRVLMAGIEVGFIDSIELVNGRAQLNLRITNDVALYKDASLAKVSESLLGDKIITLSPGSKKAGRLPDGGEIVNVFEEADMNTVFRKLDDITGDIRGVTQSLGRVLSDIERDDSLGGTMRNLSKIAENVAKLSDRVQGTLDRSSQQIERILGDVAGVTEGTRARYGEILDNIQVVTRDVRTLVSNVNDLVGQSGEGFKESVGNLRGTLEKANRSLDNLDSISRKVDEGQGTLGRLVNDDRVLDKIENLVDDATSFTSRLTRLQTIVDVRAEYQVLQNTAKYYMGLKLVPKSDKFYLIELIDDPRGAVDVTRTCTAPDVCDKVITVRDDFKFSLQLGKRYNWFGFRLGLIEDTGGMGADLYFFEDDLQFRVDMFGFGFDEYGNPANPRLKATVVYRPTWLLNHFYIAAGADDFFNESTFDFFFGAGISFDDEDLKTLFTTVGMPSF